jgi:hypothetical protein
MCDIFSRITAANVKVVYTQTGLRFAGRIGGPVPTITVSLESTFPIFLPKRFTGVSTDQHLAGADNDDGQIYRRLHNNHCPWI